MPRERINPALLTRGNYDVECGRSCPMCEFRIAYSDNCYKAWPPIDVCQAPFLNWHGDAFAEVRRCPNCGQLSWHHLNETSAKSVVRLMEWEATAANKEAHHA